MTPEQWNQRYPVGTRVVAYPFVRPEDPVAVAYRERVKAGRTFGATDPCERVETVTRSEAWLLGGHTPVVVVDGYAGGIALDCVDPAESTTDRVAAGYVETPEQWASRTQNTTRKEA